MTIWRCTRCGRREDEPRDPASLCDCRFEQVPDLRLQRDSEGRVAKTCPSCVGHGCTPAAMIENDFAEYCDQCGGEGLVPAYPLVKIFDAERHPLLCAKYVFGLMDRAMWYAEGWQDCSESDATWRARPSPSYADVRDWLLGYEEDSLVARQVALHVTRPNDFYWLQLPILF